MDVLSLMTTYIFDDLDYMCEPSSCIGLPCQMSNALLFATFPAPPFDNKLTPCITKEIRPIIFYRE